MKHRFTLRAAVIVAGIAALAGCATGRTGGGDVIAERQRLMKSNGANWADAQAKAKAGATLGGDG